jgi:hypothetical protein
MTHVLAPPARAAIAQPRSRAQAGDDQANQLQN